MKRKAKRIVPNVHKSPRNSVKIVPLSDEGLGTSVPPSLASIEIYFDQKGVLLAARDFYEEHELRAWKTSTGYPVNNWKVCAAEWIFNYRQELKRKFRMSPFYSESS
ncbi:MULTISPECIES: hypothetical protein [Mucilaginibacter]|jgi:hypothetical protein|uniref:Uncharacterized protein n=1 Tax=Mucilaginibacter ginkgonis TaxID=2682091 RepID=A0A6I4I6F0_9SPHI|nr:hypothetical protein [Mucilaginibacter ginkgonis]QQL50595.1 hypothetical protein GO620_003825 [Mucilaginibacter ginkgonis]